MAYVIKFLLLISLVSKGLATLGRIVADLQTLECKLLDLVPAVSLSNIGIPINTGYDDSQVSFYLWTRQNPEDLYELEYNNSTSLQNSKFDGSKKTYFISHGWTHSAQKYWVLEVITNLLSVEDANVIALDEPLTTEYSHAVCNVYKIARLNANFIKWLSDNSQLSPSNIHIIGHSLGAHIAGLTGYFMSLFPSFGKISRITGLDPAASLFTEEDPKKRLHKSHADFVDVIHTNGCDLHWLACLGLPDAVGHVDFYPNGGLYQPGCVDPTGEEVRKDLLNLMPHVCSHQRSYHLFAASIVLKAPQNLTFKSWPCSTYGDYQQEKCQQCTPQCLEMGFYLETNLEDQKYYLTTGTKYPYAKGDVQ